MNKSLYLSGPISNLPIETAREIFAKVKHAYLGEEWPIVVNPMEQSAETYTSNMAHDLALLDDCSALLRITVMTEGKEVVSHGAEFEVYCALKDGKEVLETIVTIEE